MSSNNNPPSLAATKSVRRPSIATAMSFLHKSSSSFSSTQGQRTPYAAAKPIRISEPQMTGSLEALVRGRAGVLGTGATVVRTPSEALLGSESGYVYTSRQQAFTESTFVEVGCELPSPPHSPPLPPLPQSDCESIASSSSKSNIEPSRPCPPLPNNLPLTPDPSPITRPLPKIRSSPPTSEVYPTLPSVPQTLLSVSPQPPFEPILLSSSLTGAAHVNHSQIIIALETCTGKHKTTLSTITSRPSHLATCLLTAIEAADPDADALGDAESDAASVYSDIQEADVDTPNFDTMFKDHLASTGVVPEKNVRAPRIEIFLDRPTAPYNHILSYLRTAPSNSPALLPRAAQLLAPTSTTFFTSRLDDLVELRDEALFLGLDELYRLCTEEIARGRCRNTGGGGHAHTSSSGSVAGPSSNSALGMSSMRPAFHTRSESARSAHSFSTSLHSVHTLVEEDEEREDDGVPAEGDRSEAKVVVDLPVDIQEKPAPQAEAGLQDTQDGNTQVRRSEPLPPATVNGLQQRLQLRERSKSRDKGPVTPRPGDGWI